VSSLAQGQVLNIQYAL